MGTCRRMTPDGACPGASGEEPDTGSGSVWRRGRAGPGTPRFVSARTPAVCPTLGSSAADLSGCRASAG